MGSNPDDVLALDDLERLAREAKGLAEAAVAGINDITKIDARSIGYIATCRSPADLALVQASRSLVPALADAVLRLVEEARLARAWCQNAKRDYDGGPVRPRDEWEALEAYRTFIAKSEPAP